MSIVGLAIRNFKRLAILAPGIVIAYFAAKDLYPQFDKFLPSPIAIIFIYILVAYVLIPLGIRLLHLIVEPKHIPLYCTTPDGLACDPINVGIVATSKELRTLVIKAGWYVADTRTLKTSLRYILCILTNRPYLQAPCSNLYLFGRPQDIAFELPVGNNPRHRHHIRFWGVTETEDPEYNQHAFFWLRYHKKRVRGKQLWVGAASLDTGIGIIRHNAQITHSIHHDTNAERDLIVKQLQKTGMIKKRRTITIGAPYKLRNRVINGSMQADGKMTICET